MTMHDPHHRPRPYRPVLFVTAVILGLIATLGTPALASPKKVTAITEMRSQVSSLRRDMSGKQLTAAERKAEKLGDPATAPGNTDGMGTPADKTLLESDQVLRETNTYSSSGTSSTTISAYGMKSDMSAIDSTPTESPLNQRSLIDQQYHSAGGHFLDAIHMGALDVKLQQSGSDGLLTLASPNQSAETWGLATAGSQLTPGSTYAIIQRPATGDVALTNASAATSGPAATQAFAASIGPGAPDPTQLWSVIDSGTGDGSFSLVNRADGLCLVHETIAVISAGLTSSCGTDPSQYWKQSYDPTTQQSSIYPADGSADLALGSSGGRIVTNTTQTWSAEALNEPGGSVPSWSTLLADANMSGHRGIPYDLAVGDLDGVVTQDGLAGGDGAQGGLSFHDEAVVAWGDPSTDTLQIRVIDYNANSSHLLVTAPGQGLTLPKGVLGASDSSLLGDVVVGVGDFNGDGQNEIAVGYQDGSYDFTFGFYSYVKNSDGSHSLVTPQGCGDPCGGQPFLSTANISAETGYADLAIGDVDGDGRDDVALGFASWASASNQTDHNAHLGVWTLNPDLSTRSAEVTDLPTDKGTLPRTLNDDGTRTQSGIRLVAGNLYSDPDDGFGPRRAELAIAYSLYQIGSADAGSHSYTVTPSVNIYWVTTTCNIVGTSCSSDTTSTNGQTEPAPLFPTHPSKVSYRVKGAHLDPAPISLVAGGFGGQATTTTDPPVDGLLASAGTEAYSDSDGSNVYWYLQTSIVVPWSADTKTSTKWAASADTQTGIGSATYPDVPATIPWKLQHYTAYDRLGQSVVLGAPSVMTIENQIKPSIIAGEPPSQVDWLNGTSSWINVGGSQNTYLETTTTSGTALSSSTTQQNGETQTAKQGAGVSVAWGTNAYFGPSESGNASINQHFSRAWSGLNTNSSQVSGQFTDTADAQTNQDDSLTYSTQNSQIWRYPVLGTVGQTTDADGCTTTCRAYYNVVVPTSQTQFPNAAGKQTSLFQPSWSNMNALSYPAVNSLQTNPMPTPDLGSYSYLSGSDSVPVDAPLYNKINTISNNNGVIRLDFTKSQGSSTTRETSRTTDVGFDLAASGTIGVGSATQGENYIDVTGTVSAGYDQTKTLDSTSIGTSTNTSDQQFTVNYPGISQDRAFNIATAYYYATDGSAKVVHGVDLTGAQLGAPWWKATYGTKADPALNLPFRIQLVADTDNVVDKPEWLTYPERQLIRGFQVLQTDDDGSGLPTATMPFTQNPVAGKRVTFQVPVHNYSLKSMDNPIQVHWTAVPIDPKTDQVTGSPIDLGDSPQQVGALGAQGTQLVTSPPWTALANTATNAAQTYRIFVQLDPTGTAASDDLHPLAGDGSPCPASSLEPDDDPSRTPALYDPMKAGSVPDPLGCGQDNQGFGLVTVSPAPGLGAERHATPQEPARAILSGGGLIDGNADHLQLTTKSAVPTVTAGQQVSGLVRARAALQLNDHPIIAVFDGPPSDHKLIAVTTMDGIDDKTGGAARFTWTPDEPGLHELHQVMLGTQSSGDDDEQIMRVNVVGLDQYRVKATGSASSVPLGGAYSITGTVSPVPEGAFARTVQLQRKDGSDWTVVDTQQTSGTGRFDFDLTGTKAGSYTYRVLKLATVGRHQKASDPITVVVGGFVVTAKASPTSIKLGKKTTIAGSVSPPMARAADRGIELQVRSGSTWKRVTRASTKASGSYAFSVKPAKKGTYSYRVVKLAAAGMRTAYSPVVTVVVKR